MGTTTSGIRHKISYFTLITLCVLSVAAVGFAQQAQDYAQGAAPLSLQSGTVLTVRIDQALSSDKNQPGDAFSATLVQPLVAQGIVVAQRGQTVTGRVIDVKKGRGFGGNSELRLALTRISLVDGQSLPIHSQLVTSRGRSNTGRDVGVVGATTATGAIIGGAAGRGEGAAIGAGVGAAAGIIGVLASNGHATVVYPETLLTFETTNTVGIDTSYAPQAFHAVDPSVYAQNAEPQLQPPPRYEQAVETAPPVVAPAPVVVTSPIVYPYPYSVYGACDPYWYPYCYAPGIRIFIGGRYYRPWFREYYGVHYYPYRRYYYPRTVAVVERGRYIPGPSYRYDPHREWGRDGRHDWGRDDRHDWGRRDDRHDWGRDNGRHESVRNGGGRGEGRGNGRGEGNGRGHDRR